VLTSNPKLPTPVQLDLRMIEADQVTTPPGLRTRGPAVDGITFDASGNPVEYLLLKEHPGDFAGLGIGV
jgi:capsid protein